MNRRGLLMGLVAAPAVGASAVAMAASDAAAQVAAAGGIPDTGTINLVIHGSGSINLDEFAAALAREIEDGRAHGFVKALRSL